MIAPDWRGFGLSDYTQSDTYWFPDYLADLDAMLLHYSPDAPVNLLGHSMGANVAGLYAGVRPERISRFVNLEGFGMMATKPEQAPGRYAKWLDELREPPAMRSYPTQKAVAERLQKTTRACRTSALRSSPNTGRRRTRRASGTSWRPAAQAGQSHPVPGGRSDGVLAPHHGARAVGGGRETNMCNGWALRSRRA